MAFLTLIDAAIHLGLRVETVQYLMKRCPKKGETRKLEFTETKQGPLFDEAELQAYVQYLNSPWPLPADATRPSIPKAFQDDIKDESHHGCAICGHMDNGEIAHIEAVAITLNNAPSNLIYLCPNHHTKYDCGFKLASNVQHEEVAAAKVLKRNARVRLLKYESFATRSLLSLIKLVQAVEKQLSAAQTDNMKSILAAEINGLFAIVPDLVKGSMAEAKNDKLATEPEKVLAKAAPKLAAIAAESTTTLSEKAIRAKAKRLASKVDDVMIEIDEVDCPHCSGRGLTGLVGDFCRYCGGSCVVSQAKHDAYDPDEIDEAPCPHCEGRGTTGLVSDFCRYCGGSCVVSQAKHDAYDPDEIDEAPCPHCEGRGTTGLVSDFCRYCGGSCVVSQAKHDAYDPDEIDEAPCPHCEGRGTTGLVSDFCRYCGGSCVVSQAKHDAYDPDEIDEAPCPHCEGRGTTGLVSDFCRYCGGSCVVSQAKHDAYDPDEIDEVPCPHCEGRGTTGLRGDYCSLCKGSCVVGRAKAKAYRRKFDR